MKNVMKAAHQLTKEIKREYPEVNYKAQLGICISYLANEEENEMVKITEGSEKQIAWAEKLIAKFKENSDKCLQQEKDYTDFEDEKDVKFYDEEVEKYNKVMKFVESQTKATWFIDNLGGTRAYTYIFENVMEG